MNLLAKLERRRLLAILRCDDVRRAADCIRVLTEENIDLVEVSLTSDRALDVLSEARAQLGDAVELGAGTVMTPAQAQAAIDAGAGYLVTPSLSAGAVEGIRLGVPVLVGALTPTEISAAVDHGATAVKLFPAEFGGPAYLKALRSPLPDVPFVPVGGVDASLARAFLDAGAVAVGVGSPLLGTVAEDGDLDSLRKRARELREAVPPVDGDQR
jgi:2-dehydro-3-deoxyphosphogluconate aldolase/(4S)-4-hydroxy-2-oxoglutarate aldolase